MLLLYKYVSMFGNIYNNLVVSYILHLLTGATLTKARSSTAGIYLLTSRHKYTWFNSVDGIIGWLKLYLITVIKLLSLSCCLLFSNYVKAKYEDTIYVDDFVNSMREPGVQERWVFMEFKKNIDSHEIGSAQSLMMFSKDYYNDQSNSDLELDIMYILKQNLEKTSYPKSYTLHHDNGENRTFSISKSILLSYLVEINTPNAFNYNDADESEFHYSIVCKIDLVNNAPICIIQEITYTVPEIQEEQEYQDCKSQLTKRYNAYPEMKGTINCKNNEQQKTYENHRDTIKSCNGSTCENEGKETNGMVVDIIINQDNNLKCNICYLSFIETDSLIKHNSSAHNIIYKCGTCNKYFLEDCDLKVHECSNDEVVKKNSAEYA